MKKVIVNSLLAVSLGFGFAVQADSTPAINKGVQRILDKAEQGDAKAQFDIAVIYYQGLRIDQNLQEAAKWYLKSAEQGYSPAQANLSSMYLQGVGVERNDAEAKKWIDKAIERGNADAVNNLGVMYLEGREVTQDKEKAIELFKQACRQSSPKGCQNYKMASLPPGQKFMHHH